MTPFKALYWRKCRSPVCWDDSAKAVVLGPQMVQDMIEQVHLIRQKMKATQDRQKSYADLHRMDIEFQVGDKVLLKVSPMRGIMRAMKLSHLAFADDLLLFCKGDFSSVKILMRAFLTFSEASRLKFNSDKSDLYLNGVGSDIAAQISRISGFQRGTLPFRYLGIFISQKRLSTTECSKLVDKIVAKIRGWGTKHLSYASRLVLVKSVLTQMHSYWARIFLLPKGVIHKVDSICRNYLWAGLDEYMLAPSVAWETCYLPCDNGGLLIINCHLLNIAVFGKYS
ncbi:uncharacterized protein LOC141627544 [Silene latifolia]|uniref:uncharacterized protein LOC141627544 n=1 Tax=Silene latifolia TaxID=37657 RepID=UPI003D77D115